MATTPTTNENHPMNLISMETQTTPFHPGNNPVLMLVAGLSLWIAGIVYLVQCGRQYGLAPMVARCYSFDCGRKLTIGLTLATAGLSLVWSAYKLELVIICGRI